MRFIALATAVAFIASSAAAAPCRDGKGKFTACPAPAAKQTCRDAKGHFSKCGSPGAKPA